MLRLCGDGDFDLDTSLDVDDDLLDDFGGGVEAMVGVSISSCLSFIISRRFGEAKEGNQKSSRPISSRFFSFPSPALPQALLGNNIVLTQLIACGFSTQTYPRSWNPHHKESFGS